MVAMEAAAMEAATVVVMEEAAMVAAMVVVMEEAAMEAMVDTEAEAMGAGESSKVGVGFSLTR